LAESIANAFNSAFGATGLPVKLTTEKIEDVTASGTAELIGVVTNDGKITATGTAYLKPQMGPVPSGSSYTYPGNPLNGFATGIKDSPTTYDSLVGEEGPELIQRNNGTAYLSGTEGPEVTTINKGETVYTAEETEDIFSENKGKSIPRFALGSNSSYGA
jgi:hypothetical protein